VLADIGEHLNITAETVGALTKKTKAVIVPPFGQSADIKTIVDLARGKTFKSSTTQLRRWAQPLVAGRWAASATRGF
jgi:hypothetical protein